jgi:organic radical activating enzyme
MFEKLEYLKPFFNMDSDNYRCCILQCSFNCNINCSCCYVERNLKRRKDRCPPHILEKVIKECSELDIPLYTGVGDPFAWWDYTRDYLIPYLHKYNAKGIISTNGLWGGNEQVLKEAIAANIDILILSVDPWHQQGVPIKNIENILTAFRESSTKIFVASIYEKEEDKEKQIIPYNDEIERIWYLMDHQNLDNHYLFTHNWNGKYMKSYSKNFNTIKELLNDS